EPRRVLQEAPSEQQEQSDQRGDQNDIDRRACQGMFQGSLGSDERGPVRFLHVSGFPSSSYRRPPRRERIYCGPIERVMSFRSRIALAVALVLAVSSFSLYAVVHRSVGEPQLPPRYTPRTLAGTTWPIKHVVIIVKENRTFDQLFGQFPGADGATMAN